MAGTEGYEAGQQDQDRSTIRISGVLRSPSPTGGFGAASGAGGVTGGVGGVAGGVGGVAGGVGGAGEPAARRGRHGAEEVHVVTGVPVTRPAAPAVAFDVFTPLRRSEPGSVPGADAPYSQSYPDFGGQAADDTSYVSPYSGPAIAGYREAGTSPVGPGHQDTQSRGDGPGSGYDSGSGYEGGYGNNADSAVSSPMGEPDGSAEFKGLPRRVRQANLAPQLRASTAQAAAASAQEASVPRATAASLADMRNTLSAMQRGWQQGRSQTQPDTEGGADGN
jgi:hypothetical protein